MQKTESFLITLRKRRPIRSRFFQKYKCAIYIGSHKVVRAADRAIDMTFRRKMNNPAGLALQENAAHSDGVNDIRVHKLVSSIVADFFQVPEVAGVGQLVKIDDPRAFCL